jgi:hypothetical protein
VPLGGKLGARSLINDACHWPGIMGASVRQTHHDRPLSAADLELLWAVPAGACLPRRRPDTSARSAASRKRWWPPRNARSTPPGCLTPSRHSRPA